MTNTSCAKLAAVAVQLEFFLLSRCALVYVPSCSEGVEFSAFLEGEGFTIIPIKHEHQLAYACNVLNLGNGRIISVHADSARQIVKHPAFKGDVQVRSDCPAAGRTLKGWSVTQSG
jgi:hypothetical protein